MFESKSNNGVITYAEIDRLADRGDRINMAYKKSTRAKKMVELCKMANDVERAQKQGKFGEWKQKREELKEAVVAKEQERKAFVEPLHDRQRQRNTLDTYGSALIKLLSEMTTDAVDQKKRGVARKLEAAISELHDVIDAAEEALDELGK